MQHVFTCMWNLAIKFSIRSEVATILDPVAKQPAQLGWQGTTEWGVAWDTTHLGSFCVWELGSSTALWAHILQGSVWPAGSHTARGSPVVWGLHHLDSCDKAVSSARYTENTRVRDHLGNIPPGFLLHAGAGQLYNCLGTCPAGEYLTCRKSHSYRKPWGLRTPPTWFLRPSSLLSQRPVPHLT